MKKRIIWLSLALVAGQAGHAFAQDASDALRYSRQQFGGPARTQGIAGANVALGADFGNLSSNPAGLGLYQKSELHFTPGLGLGLSEGRMEGSAAAAQSTNKNSFHVASGGLVLTGRKADDDQSSNWRGGSLAFGFTRTADFNISSLYSGTLSDRAGTSANNQSYLTSLEGIASPSYFTNIRSQATSGDYTSADGLAYGAYLTNIVKTRRPGATGVDSAVVMRARRGPIGQSESVVNRGSMSQFDIGYGASYRDRLYIGAALGIVSSNFRSTRDFTETETDASTQLNSYTLRDDLSTTGRGINFRIGAIYRVADFVRLGASIQTPTFMNMTDVYNSRITTDFSALPASAPILANDPRVPAEVTGVTSVDALENIYDYSLSTPFRASGGAVFTIGKYGFLTGDVEYVGYNQARLSNANGEANGDDYSFADENTDVRSRYRETVNVRLGGEFRYDVFRLRAGYARYGDPYQTPGSVDRTQNFITGGAGLRQGNFFLDAAVVYHTFNQAYTPYSIGNGQEPLIKVNNNRYTTSVTAGVTF